MRLESRKNGQNFGSVEISPTQDVIELEAGSSESSDVNVVVTTEKLDMIKKRMVIVVCAKDEDIRVIEDVWGGIPHNCLIIFVSNSKRQPTDAYELEVRALRTYCDKTKRDAIAIHQGDPVLASAFKTAGMGDIVDEKLGRIRHGKGEAMIVGMALAATTGRKYIGYLDADNNISGSVREYCDVFAGGISIADKPMAMVRILWKSKPKVEGGEIVYETQGRSSKLVNQWLNNVLKTFDKRGTDIIKTGNAGEHAMTLELGLKLRLASGFAIEPYELIDIFEQFGPNRTTGQNQDIDIVQLLQVKTLNPHLHTNRGDQHVESMRSEGLEAIYHSELVKKLPEDGNTLRTYLKDAMITENMLVPGKEPEKVRIYDPVGGLNLQQICRRLVNESMALNEIKCGQKVKDGYHILKV